MDGSQLRWAALAAAVRTVSNNAYSLRKKFGKECVEVQQEADKDNLGFYPGFRLLESEKQSEIFETIKNLIVNDILYNQTEPIYEKIRPQLLPHEKRIWISAVLDKSPKDVDITRPMDYGVKEIDFKVNKRRHVKKPWEFFNETMKQLILVLRGILTHEVLFAVLQKRWRVDYGAHPTRQHYQMAVPFRAKDVASDRTEFGHPDIALLLTVANYYQSGLSKQQLKDVFFCLEQRITESEAKAIYREWAQHCPPAARDRYLKGLMTFESVNLSDTLLFEQKLYPAYSKHMDVINFWLFKMIFPKQAKQFPQKVIATPWDLCRQPEKNSSSAAGGGGVLALTGAASADGNANINPDNPLQILAKRCFDQVRKNTNTGRHGWGYTAAELQQMLPRGLIPQLLLQFSKQAPELFAQFCGKVSKLSYSFSASASGGTSSASGIMQTGGVHAFNLLGKVLTQVGQMQAKALGGGGKLQQPLLLANGTQTPNALTLGLPGDQAAQSDKSKPDSTGQPGSNNKKKTDNPWDLGYFLGNNSVTTGFSGTDDLQFVLPLTIEQKNLPSLEATNGVQLRSLLKPESDFYYWMKTDTAAYEILDLIAPNVYGHDEEEDGGKKDSGETADPTLAATTSLDTRGILSAASVEGAAIYPSVEGGNSNAVAIPGSDTPAIYPQAGASPKGGALMRSLTRGLSQDGIDSATSSASMGEDMRRGSRGSGLQRSNTSNKMNVDELPSMVERAISQSRLGLPPGGLQRANSSQGSGLDAASSVGGSSRGKNLLRAGSSSSVGGVGGTSGASLISPGLGGSVGGGTASWKLGSAAEAIPEEAVARLDSVDPVLAEEIRKREEISDTIRNQPVNVVLDPGALVLQLSNHEFCKKWLLRRADMEAAVFFDEQNIIRVIDRDHLDEDPVSFALSPYADDMSLCLLYLDDVHTRGSDFRLPINSRALLTLGKGMPKDKFLQACMRMRQIGHGQNISFVASKEVHRALQRTNVGQLNVRGDNIFRQMEDDNDQGQDPRSSITLMKSSTAMTSASAASQLTLASHHQQAPGPSEITAAEGTVPNLSFLCGADAKLLGREDEVSEQVANFNSENSSEEVRMLKTLKYIPGIISWTLINTRKRLCDLIPYFSSQGRCCITKEQAYYCFHKDKYDETQGKIRKKLEKQRKKEEAARKAAEKKAAAKRKKAEKKAAALAKKSGKKIATGGSSSAKKKKTSTKKKKAISPQGTKEDLGEGKEEEGEKAEEKATEAEATKETEVKEAEPAKEGQEEAKPDEEKKSEEEEKKPESEEKKDEADDAKSEKSDKSDDDAEGEDGEGSTTASSDDEDKGGTKPMHGAGGGGQNKGPAATGLLKVAKTCVEDEVLNLAEMYGHARFLEALPVVVAAQLNTLKFAFKEDIRKVALMKIDLNSSAADISAAAAAKAAAEDLDNLGKLGEKLQATSNKLGTAKENILGSKGKKKEEEGSEPAENPDPNGTTSGNGASSVPHYVKLICEILDHVKRIGPRVQRYGSLFEEEQERELEQELEEERQVERPGEEEGQRHMP